MNLYFKSGRHFIHPALILCCCSQSFSTRHPNSDCFALSTRFTLVYGILRCIAEQIGRKLVVANTHKLWVIKHSRYCDSLSERTNISYWETECVLAWSCFFFVKRMPILHQVQQQSSCKHWFQSTSCRRPPVIRVNTMNGRCRCRYIDILIVSNWRQIPLAASSYTQLLVKQTCRRWRKCPTSNCTVCLASDNPSSRLNMQYYYVIVM